MADSSVSRFGCYTNSRDVTEDRPIRDFSCCLRPDGFTL
jgi:hypothetical protein